MGLCKLQSLVGVRAQALACVRAAQALTAFAVLWVIGGAAGKVESGKENAYSCAVMAGWRTPQERRDNLLSFKEGDVRFLICTDVAARGIDIKGLPYVINLTLPAQAGGVTLTLTLTLQH